MLEFVGYCQENVGYCRKLLKKLTKNNNIFNTELGCKNATVRSPPDFTATFVRICRRRKNFDFDGKFWKLGRPNVENVVVKSWGTLQRFYYQNLKIIVFWPVLWGQNPLFSWNLWILFCYFRAYRWSVWHKTLPVETFLCFYHISVTVTNKYFYLSNCGLDSPILRLWENFGYSGTSL